MSSKKKSELEQENNELRQRLSSLQRDTKLYDHTHQYLHVPLNKHRLLAFAALCGSVGLAVLNMIMIVWAWGALRIPDLFAEDFAQWGQLLILWPLLGEYVLVGLSIVCLVAMFKGGFSRLKSYSEEGLIRGLIRGLILWLILGFIWGLILGLIRGLIGGLIVGLIMGLISGLIVGLIGGLILGLIGGADKNG